MNIEVAIIETSEPGVQVRIGDGAPMWLPRHGPGIEWQGGVPEPGNVAWVRLPTWLVAKHKQLQELRFQRSLAFVQPAGLDPAKAERPLPMAEERPRDVGHGALFRNLKKESERHPDYRGDVTVNGTKYALAAWLKTDKNGHKYMSLALSEIPDQQQHRQPEPHRNEYAETRGRDQPQREPVRYGGGLPPEQDIPFAPEVR